MQHITQVLQSRAERARVLHSDDLEPDVERLPHLSRSPPLCLLLRCFPCPEAQHQILEVLCHIPQCEWLITFFKF